MHVDEAPLVKGQLSPPEGPYHRGSQLIGDLENGPWIHVNCLEPNLDVAPHSHNEDEVIVVIGGELAIGDRKCGPGTVIYNEKDTDYGFRVGPLGVRFLNIRPGLAQITIGGKAYDTYRGDEPKG